MFDLTGLQASLKVLSTAYAAELPGKIEQLEQAWNQLPQSGWDDQSFASMHRMVHSLTGSGKTFGFAALSDVARNLEDYLKQLAPQKTALSEDQRNHVQELMRELHRAILCRDAAPGD